MNISRIYVLVFFIVCSCEVGDLDSEDLIEDGDGDLDGGLTNETDSQTVTKVIEDTDEIIDDSGEGLTGIYFNGRSFEEKVLERVDDTVDFDWSAESPDSKINQDSFSVRWLGSVRADYSETYTFKTTSDDGIRLWIDNKLIIDDWTDHATKDNEAIVALQAGQLVPLKLEYYENSKFAVAKLSWSSVSQTEEIIPRSNLFTDYDLCPDDPNKIDPGRCGCGHAEDSCEREITHVGTTSIWHKTGQDVPIERPKNSKSGDLLVLYLHRTDDRLASRVPGWTMVAECFKRGNGDQCVTSQQCKNWFNGDEFCRDFIVQGSTHCACDLAHTVHYKVVGPNEPGSYTFDFNPDPNRPTGSPAWIVLTALRGANKTDPVRDWSNTGCDKSSKSVFPSVYGVKGDMILLSQSFDDFVQESKFLAPDGMKTFGYVGNSDETGYLFGGLLNHTGDTGKITTNGPGASGCKDALISVTIKPQ